MIQRVSSALVKFLTPLTTPTDLSKEPDHPPPEQSGFQRFKQDAPLEHSSELPKDPTKGAAPESSSQGDHRPPLPISKTEPTPTPFANLISLLQGQTHQFSKWLGNKAYQGAVKNQKKTGKFRKGTVLDEKAD